MQNTLIMKFGGTSVGSADALKNCTQIIRDAKKDWNRVVVVTSAMSGVTNLLLDSAASASHGKVDSLSETESTLREKHFAAADALIKDENLREQTKAEINTLIQSLVDLCKAIAVLGEASPRAMDAVASLGERMSVRLVVAVVNMGVPSNVHKNYYPNDESNHEPTVRWRGHANLLYSNWLNYYVYQATPYDVNKIPQ